MAIKKIVGGNIRYYRCQLGWSQEKLAVRSRLSVNFVSALERSAVTISVDNLEKIANALKIEMYLLFVDKGSGDG